MRYLIITTILLLSFQNGRTQSRMPLKGVLKDSTTNEAVPFAHVRNISAQEMTVTGTLGKFQLMAKTGDTVIFSSVGYETLGWIIKDSYFNYEKAYKLPLDTILLNDVLISSLPTEERFKKAILEYQPEDTSFWYHAVPEPVMTGDPSLEEDFMKSPLAFLAHPLTGWYYRFSKQEKEKRKYHKVSQQESISSRVARKITREWMTEVTQLEGDELTSFIHYCDFSLDYLDKTPYYIIQEEMLVLLVKFKKSRDG